MKITDKYKPMEELKPGDVLMEIIDNEGNKTELVGGENNSGAKQLDRWLQFIEDENNYYAGFLHVIEYTVLAKQEAKRLCFDTTVFSDAQYHACLSRIEAAREKAIKTHGVLTIKMLEQNKTQHTPRTLVSSVYSDIFGIELKGEDAVKAKPQVKKVNFEISTNSTYESFLKQYYEEEERRRLKL